MAERTTIITSALPDLTRADLDEVRRRTSPVLVQSIQRILAEADDPDPIAAGFNASI